MTTVYSHSRLSSFENCPKQFHFRYVLQIPAESEGVEAFVGKLVHEVLERLYRFVENGRIPPLDRVVQRYHAMWDERFDAERIRIVKDLPLHHYRSLGARCIENYYRRHYPFDVGTTLGLESRVAFALDEQGRYPFQGFIDRVVRAEDGAIEVHDYKTGGYVPTQARLDEDRQLALYQIGLGERYGTASPMRLVWHYLARGQLRTSERTPEQLDTLRQKTIRLIDEIESETEFAPRKIKLCDWCEYRAVCPAWGADAPSPSPSVTLPPTGLPSETLPPTTPPSTTLPSAALPDAALADTPLDDAAALAIRSPIARAPALEGSPRPQARGPATAGSSGPRQRQDEASDESAEPPAEGQQLSLL